VSVVLSCSDVESGRFGTSRRTIRQRPTCPLSVSAVNSFGCRGSCCGVLGSRARTWIRARTLRNRGANSGDPGGRSLDLLVLLANSAAFKAGYNYGETTELLPVHYRVPKAKLPPGRYRKITGNEALALSLTTAAVLADKDMLYAGYPITPASDILHHLVTLKNYPVSCIQAEDGIAAAGMAARTRSRIAR